jgi:iron complex transport system substrate-binding protein
MRATAFSRTPRTVVLEWTDPPYAPGHWIPEMVALAGGRCVLGEPGQRSVRVAWQDVRDADPEVVVCAPCGYGLEQSVALAEDLVAAGELPPAIPVWAVDANASFARPGPRLVDGVEALAEILHPHIDNDSGIVHRVR